MLNWLNQALCARPVLCDRLALRATICALFWASQAAWAQCPEVKENSGAYTATCAGRNQCAAIDTMTLAPTTTAVAALKSVCLKLRDTGDLILVDIPSSADGKPMQQSIALMNSLADTLTKEDALAKPNCISSAADKCKDSTPKKPLTMALKNAGAGTVGINVLWSDTQGQTGSQPIELDGSELWRTRRVKLAIDKATCNPTPCRIDGWLLVSAPGLEAWAAATKKDASKVFLMLGEVRFPALQTSLGDNDHMLAFRLSRDVSKPESLGAWTNFLASQTPASAASGVRVALADDLGIIAPAILATDVKFQAGESLSYFFIIAAIVAILILLIVWRLGGIRDDAPDPSLSKHMPFSLARSQMLLWTITIIVAWIFCALTVGDFSGPNGTALTLMGIGVGTTIGAATVAINKPSFDAIAQANLKAYNDACKVIKNPEAEANSQGKNKDEVKQEAIKKRDDATAEMKKAGLWSQNIFLDVISPVDSSGMALYRIQMLVFTVILFGVYVIQLIQTRSMPVFTDTQLGLLGISGSTYVGFKFANKG